MCYNRNICFAYAMNLYICKDGKYVMGSACLFKVAVISPDDFWILREFATWKPESHWEIIRYSIKHTISPDFTHVVKWDYFLFPSHLMNCKWLQNTSYIAQRASTSHDAGFPFVCCSFIWKNLEILCLNGKVIKWIFCCRSRDVMMCIVHFCFHWLIIMEEDEPEILLGNWIKFEILESFSKFVRYLEPLLIVALASVSV